MKNGIITITILKKYLLLIYFLFISLLASCTSSLGKKGEWNATYRQEFVSNCKAETQAQKSLVKIDSITVSKICDCVAQKAEKEFAPLETEAVKSQTQIKNISTDCANEILMDILN
ncbi:hypothetical protein Fleli_3176 [Bernardetia litoralis DSM 6794]|uniref:Lipoprotein n=1 Tax=Bernardetia litoralis (strain ATCC 23117 / DSM 6794 / NBRC 15988 / NCIMB 1366 / Fx l1 / Sio-4) TaxID=880071 RepID=I4ANH3_BERLS|nr:hypothetical protein [Bernardetia litoralis]AFM05508.1 hypothetical protein Fleli_3176 [Bernardetia litoralis DSM 6794]